MDRSARKLPLPAWHDKPFEEWPAGAHIVMNLLAIAAERWMAEENTQKLPSAG